MAINEREFTQLANSIAMMSGHRMEGYGYSPKIAMLQLLATYAEPGLKITVEEDKKTGTISWNFNKES